MKKIIYLISVLTLSLSCSDDITNLNSDIKNPVTVPAEFLFTNAQKALVDQMTSTNVNLNVFRLFTQQWTETVYTDESNYDITTRTIPDNHFRTFYREILKDLSESKKVILNENPATEEQKAVQKNKLAVIDILTSYCYSVLVDTFGNIPYSEALDIENHQNPKYDDAISIYKDLITKLTVSVDLMNLNFESFGSADIIYNGNVNNWKKFANSLRLKLAINMDDVDHNYASTQALAAVNSGVLSSNSENAALKYLSEQPNANPIFVDVVASGRDDFVPTNTIINKMNMLNDPRREKYFSKTDVDYVGGVPGAGNTFANFSHIGDMLLAPTFEALIMDYSEVEFLLAEAIERNIAVGGSAASHYNNAIIASFSYWNVSGTDTTIYLAQANVDYTTATGNWKSKIGEQAYLALYNRGFEAWTSYRRLDFPVLVAPADATIAEVPKRYTYPSAEQTLNTDNNSAAATAIGGDFMTTKLFWDKN